MTNRRLAQSIHTREVIPTSLAGDDSCYLLAMTGDQIEILSNLMNYAHRRINWCDEVIDSAHYFLPDDDTWDDLQALVDDLEYRLMDVCELSELITAIQDLCTCLPTTQQLLPGPLSSGALQDGLDDGSIVFPEPETDLESDEDACASAQVLWSMIYEYVSEVAIPLADASFELVVPAVLGLIASWGIAVAALLWYGITLETIQEMLQAGMDSNGTAVLNWLVSAKQELVCAIYNFFRSGSCVDWASVDTLIENGDAPALTRFFLKRAFRWLRRTAQLFSGTAWALLRIEEGYCDECGQPAGCVDFCDLDWTIDPNYGLLDPDACTLTLYGELGSPTAATRAVSDIEYVTVTLDFDPPSYAPPAFSAVTVYIRDADFNEESFTFQTSDNGRQVLYHPFALADPIELQVRSVAGTHTVCYDLCVEETT